MRGRGRVSERATTIDSPPGFDFYRFCTVPYPGLFPLGAALADAREQLPPGSQEFVPTEGWRVLSYGVLKFFVCEERLESVYCDNLDELTMPSPESGVTIVNPWFLAGAETRSQNLSLASVTSELLRHRLDYTLIDRPSRRSATIRLLTSQVDLTFEPPDDRTRGQAGLDAYRMVAFAQTHESQRPVL